MHFPQLDFHYRSNVPQATDSCRLARPFKDFHTLVCSVIQGWIVIVEHGNTQNTQKRKVRRVLGNDGGAYVQTRGVSYLPHKKADCWEKRKTCLCSQLIYNLLRNCKMLAFAFFLFFSSYRWSITLLWHSKRLHVTPLLLTQLVLVFWITHW